MSVSPSASALMLLLGTSLGGPPGAPLIPAKPIPVPDDSLIKHCELCGVDLDDREKEVVEKIG